MTQTLALLHTVAGLVPTFQELCRELLPGVETFNLVDESLLKTTIRAGCLTPATSRRVVTYVAAAEEAGADALLVTCSSIGPAVELARSFVQIPVLRVDEAMADQAVQLGRRVGVAATLPTTLEPTAELVRARAAAAGRTLEIVAHHCAGAFEALGRGDAAAHDALVAAGLRDLAARVDVIVLAQASMARVAAALGPADLRVPVLSSPRSGVERARDVLAGRVAPPPTRPTGPVACAPGAV
jgi:Asp/Glu/hydantoin racemase